MGKTIIISERQLKDILEGDASYLEINGPTSNEYNGHTEVSTGGKIDDKGDANPLTGDKFASKRVSMNFWNGLGKGKNGSIMVNCSKKKTQQLSETNNSLKSRTWVIPKKIKDILTQNYENFNGDKNAPGFDRLRNLLTMPHITYYELKRLKNFYDNMTDSNQNEYELYGGNLMKQWVEITLSTSRDCVETNKESNKKNGNSNSYRTSPTNNNVIIYN